MNNISHVQSEGISGSGGDGSDDWEFLKVLFYVHAQRLGYLDNVSQKDLEIAADSHAKVSKLHDLIARINEITDKEKGTIKVEKGSELEKLLEEAKKEGVRISKTEGEFNDKEVQRLLENIKFHVEDRNAFNESLAQKLQRFTNERYEMYTMTRTFLKGINDDMVNKARSIKGG